MRNQRRIGATMACVLLAGLGVGAVPAIAQNAAAPSPAPSPAPAAQPDPAFQAAQKAFEALPEAERKAIQDDLVWATDFRGGTSGSFGPLTYKAVSAWQKANAASADGLLKPEQRAVIAAAAAKARAAAKFAVLADGKTGIRIGVPQKLLDRAQPGRTGMRWASSDGSSVLETSVETGPLAALFDRFNLTPGRKVTYKLLRPDWFVITSEGAGQRSYVRYAAVGDKLKGFVFSYPVAGGPELDRLSVAIANSFDPAPAPGPAVATAGPAPVPPAGAAPSAQPSAARSTPGASGLVATGIVVAPGKVLTIAAAACGAPSAGGLPAKPAAMDKETGLALLEVPGLKAKPAILMPGGATDGAALVAVGFAEQRAGAPLLMVASAEARVPQDGSQRIFAPLQRAAGGSLVLDRQGGLAGIVSGAAQEPRLVAGIAPAASWPLVGTAAVARLLQQAGTNLTPGSPPASTLSAGDLAARARDSLVPVSCGP